MKRPTLRRTLQTLGIAGLGVVSVLALSRIPDARADLATISGQTLDVKANTLDVDINRGRATLEGDVHATLGELTVVCPKAELAYDEAPQAKSARGTGGAEAKVQGM